jgi:HEPN domain
MRDADVRKFLRAADQRWTSAEILYRNAMHLDAMYLAGYVPECALKALILSRVPGSKHARYLQEHFRGAGAHQYEYLRYLLRTLNVTIPLPISKRLTTIATWSTDLRYEVGLKKAAEAESFLAAAKAVRDWVERSLE